MLSTVRLFPLTAFTQLAFMDDCANCRSNTPVLYAAEGIFRNAHRTNALSECMPYVGFAGVGVGSALFHMLLGHYSQTCELYLLNMCSALFCSEHSRCGHASTFRFKGNYLFTNSASSLFVRRRACNALHDRHRPPPHPYQAPFKDLHHPNRDVPLRSSFRVILRALHKTRAGRASDHLRRYDRGYWAQNHEVGSEHREPFGQEESFGSSKSGCW
jgi:hypothetical protein